MLGETEKGKPGLVDGLFWVEECEVPDQWMLRCALDDLIVQDTDPDAPPEGTLTDAAWTENTNFGSGLERNEYLERAIVFIARYSHQQIWAREDEIEVCELRRFQKRLIELMQKEGVLQNATENG